MEKLRSRLRGWIATLRIMMLDRYAYGVLREPFNPDDFAEAPRPGTTEDSVWALIADWRDKARVKRVAAQLLGDCAAGLETFTEATVLSACADEAEKVLVPWQPRQEQETGNGA